MPELTPIETWATTNEDVTSEASKYLGYAAFAKQQYLNEAGDNYDEKDLAQTFSIIDETMAEKVRGLGLSEEELASELKPKDISFESKLRQVRQSSSTIEDVKEREAVLNYTAFLRQAEHPDTSPEYLKRGPMLKLKAQEVVGKYFNDAARENVANGDAPFTRIEDIDAEGNTSVRIVGGPSASGLGFRTAFQTSLDAGTIRPEDIGAVQALMQKNSAGHEAYKVENMNEILPHIQNAFLDPENEIAQLDFERLLDDMVDDGELQSDGDHLVLAKQTLFDAMPTLRDQYSEEEIDKAIEFIVGTKAMQGGLIERNEDTNSLNIRQYGYGQYAIHRDLLMDGKLFNDAIQGMDEGEQRRLSGQREVLRESQYDNYSKSLENSYLNEEWDDFHASKRGTGMSNSDILEEFTKTDVYDPTVIRAKHIGSSITDAVTDLIYGAGTALEIDGARENLIDNLRERKARQDIASLFNDSMGWKMDLATMVAPVVTDIVATGGITALTGGVGAGAALLSVGAKNSARKMFRMGLAETLEQGTKAGARSVEQSALRNSLALTGKEAIEQAPRTIKNYAEHYSALVSSKGVTLPALFTTSATRSGTMTYASVFDALENTPEGAKLSADEKHDKAMLAGVTAAFTTGMITSMFTLGGWGGLENYVLRGATGKQVKSVFQRIQGSGLKLTDKQYAIALKSFMDKGSKEFFKRFGNGGFLKETARNVSGEALEEGMDEWFNTIIQHSVTHQDLPFRDIGMATIMGGAYGGVFGGAMPIARKGFQKVSNVFSSDRSMSLKALQTRDAEKAVYGELAAKLNKLSDAGSPFTAAAIRNEVEKLHATAKQKARLKADAEAPQVKPEKPAETRAEADTEAEGVPAGQEPAVAAEPAAEAPTQSEFSSLEDADQGEFGLTPDSVEQVEKAVAEVEAEEASEEVADNVDLTTATVPASTGEDIPIDADLFAEADDPAKAAREMAEKADTDVAPAEEEVDLGVSDLKQRIRKKRKEINERQDKEAAEAFAKEEAEAADEARLQEELQEEIQKGLQKDAEAAKKEEAKTAAKAKAAKEQKRKEELQKKAAAAKKKADAAKKKADAAKKKADAEAAAAEKEAAEKASAKAAAAAAKKKAAAAEKKAAATKRPLKERGEDVIDTLVSFGFPVTVQSQKYGLPKEKTSKTISDGWKKRFGDALKEAQKDKKSHSYVWALEDIHKAYKTGGRDDIRILASGIVRNYTTGQYLFNNDPAASLAALNAWREVVMPEDVGDLPVNKNVFVYETGDQGSPVLLDVRRPSKLGSGIESAVVLSTPDKNAPLRITETQAQKMALAHTYRPSDVEMHFSGGGLVASEVFATPTPAHISESAEDYQARLESLNDEALDEGEIRFTVHDQKTPAAAIEVIDKWVNENYQQLVENTGSDAARLFNAATKLGKLRLGYTLESDLRSVALGEFTSDLKFDIMWADIRRNVEGLLNEKGELEGENLAKAVKIIAGDGTANSGMLSEPAVREAVTTMRDSKKRVRIHKGTKSESSDMVHVSLDEKTGGHVQRAATLLYSTLAGQSKLVTRLQEDADFLKALGGASEGGKRTVLRARENKKNISWEYLLIGKLVSRMITEDHAKKADGSEAFPQFYQKANHVGSRVMKRAGMVKAIQAKNVSFDSGDFLSFLKPPTAPDVDVDSDNPVIDPNDTLASDSEYKQTLGGLTNEESVNEGPSVGETSTGNKHFADFLARGGKGMAQQFSQNAARLYQGRGRSEKAKADQALFALASALAPFTPADGPVPFVLPEGETSVASSFEEAYSPLLFWMGSRARETPNYFNSLEAAAAFRNFEKAMPKHDFDRLRPALALFSGSLNLNTDTSVEVFHKWHKAAVEEFAAESSEAPSIIRKAQARYYRKINEKRIRELGLESGNPESVLLALETIAKEGNPSHQAMAELILANTSIVLRNGFTITDEAGASAGNFVTYPDGRTDVNINIAGYYGNGVDSVLLHEYAHALTATLLRADPKTLTPKQLKAKKDLEALLKKARDAHRGRKIEGIEIANGLANMDEFIASLFTSATFQDSIRNKLGGGLFRKLLDAIKSLFGIKPKSLLGKAFDDIVDFANMETAPEPSMIARIDKRAKTMDEMNYVDKVMAGVIRYPSPAALKLHEQRFTSLEASDMNAPMTEKQRAVMDEIIDDTIRENVPEGVNILEAGDLEGINPFADRPKALFASNVIETEQGPRAVIFINRTAAQYAVSEFASTVENSVHVKMILEAVLNEEMTHTAEFQTISDDELDSLAESLTERDFFDIINRYTTDPANRIALRNGVTQGDRATLHQLIGEDLRMKTQKLLRGSTTEEDVAFYAGNPRFHQVMFRYVAGIFRRIYAKFNLRRNNGEMSRMVNRMAHEMKLLRSGVFRVPSLMPFNVDSPNEGWNDLKARFSAVADENGLKDIHDGTTMEQIIERLPMFAGYTIPLGLFASEGYKPREGIAKWANGELSPFAMKLKRQSEAVERAVNQRAETVLRELKKLLDDTPSLTNELLADYMGRPDDIEVSLDFEKTRNNVFRIAKDRMQKERKRDLTNEEHEVLYKQVVTDKVEAEQVKLTHSAKARKTAAQQVLSNEHPEVFAKLHELRIILDSLSKTFSSEFDVDGELSAVIDTRLGIYVTRSYRAFLEEGYMDKIMAIAEGQAGVHDASLVAHFEQVYDLFEETYANEYANTEYKKNKAHDTPKKDMPPRDELIQEAKDHVKKRRINHEGDPVRQAIVEYLYALDGNSRFTDSRTPLKPLATSVAKSVVDNIREKKNLPHALRELLGQYDEGDVLNNIIRSIGVVNHAAARESFHANLITWGQKSENQFVFTLKEIKEKMRAGENMNHLVNLRKGFRVKDVDLDAEILPDEVESKYSQSLNYYIDERAYDALQIQFQKESIQHLSTDKKWVEQGANVIRAATGVSLATKTLGSIGFYIRNVLGNIAFFAPAQGLSPFKVMAKMGHIKDALKGDPKAVDAYTAELISYDILHGDLTSELIRELLYGNTTLKKIEAELEETSSKVAKLKDTAKKVGGKVSEKIAPVMDRLMALSQAVDGFYKIAYFENELAVMRDAQSHDQANGTDTGFLNLTEHELKTKAAWNVRQTTQSYVDSYESIKHLTKKYGVILAPFLRFRFDIIRIAFDGTPRLIKAELKSENPVIKARGFKRLFGYTSVMGGVSLALPTLLRMYMGMGEEEDELFRASVPDYQKDSTFFFIGDSAWDFTFMNPFASVMDPALRFLEDSLRGDVDGGIVRVIGMFFKEYGGEQILGKSVFDVKNNENSATGDPIFESNDGYMKIIKSLGYIFEEAYEPRTMSAFFKGVDAALGDEALDSRRSALGIAAREFLPTRPRTVDYANSFQRFLSTMRDERNRRRSIINTLKTKGSLRAGELQAVTRDFVDSQLEIDSEIAKKFQAARNMGVPEKDLVRSMKYYKMSNVRIKNIGRGRMDLPATSPTLRKDLKQMGEVGEIRLKNMEAFKREHYRKILPLDLD